MIQILHNPRCSKSREGLQYLKDKNLEFELVEYLKNPLSEEELFTLSEKLNLKPKDFIRLKEQDFKTLSLKEKLDDDSALISAMASYPKLIERPIVINGDKAVVGRPTGNIDTVL